MTLCTNDSSIMNPFTLTNIFIMLFQYLSVYYFISWFKYKKIPQTHFRFNKFHSLLEIFLYNKKAMGAFEYV